MKPTRSSWKTEHCFTLVEMIVAMTILAFVALIAGTAVTAFQRSYAQAQKFGARLERQQAIDRFMDSFVRNAVPFFWRDTEAADSTEERPVFQGDSDELWFTARRVVARDGESALIFCRLYLNDDHQLACDYRLLPFLPWEEPAAQIYKTEIIASDVEAIRFHYAAWDENNDVELLEEWIEDDHDSIPAAIQLTVEWRDGGKTAWLRRVAGSSGNSTLETGTE